MDASTPESVKRRTVVVCGLPATVTTSEIENYFESSRSGGGDVEDVIVQDRKSGCAHIIFEDEDDAESVAKRQHLIRNAPANVELLVPRVAAAPRQRQAPPNRAVASPASISGFQTMRDFTCADPITNTSPSPEPGSKAAAKSSGLVAGIHSATVTPEHGPHLSEAHRAPEPPPPAAAAMPHISNPASHVGSSSSRGSSSSGMAQIGRSMEKRMDDLEVVEVGSVDARHGSGEMLHCDSGGVADEMFAGPALGRGGHPGFAYSPAPTSLAEIVAAAKSSRYGAARPGVQPTSVQSSDPGLPPPRQAWTPLPSSSTGCNVARQAQVPTHHHQSQVPTHHHQSVEQHASMAMDITTDETRVVLQCDMLDESGPKTVHEPANNTLQALTLKRKASSELPTPPAQQAESPMPVSPYVNQASLDMLIQTSLPGSPSSPADNEPMQPATAENENDLLSLSQALALAVSPSGRLVSVSCDLSMLAGPLLEMYFDSRKASAGGGVERLTQLSATLCYVVFEDFEAAERVAAREHHINGVSLSVKHVLPQDPAMRKVLVSKLSQGCDEESLELYFESVKHSRGGPVTHVMLSDCLQHAVVTFESPDVAAGVASRSHAIRKGKVDVRLLSEIQPPCCSLSVQGIPPVVGQEELEMYFESKKRSGGGEFTELIYKQESGSATVKFPSPFAVNSVLARTHTLRGTPVNVCCLQTSGIYLSEDGTTFQVGDRQGSGGFDPNKVILVDIPATVSEDRVNLYLKSAFPNSAGVDVEAFPENRRVLATFPTAIDFAWLDQYVAREALGKHHIQVRRVPLTRLLRVRSEQDIGLSAELLKYYFKAEMNIDVIVHLRHDTLDVEFPNIQTARRAMTRQHCVSGSTLDMCFSVAGIHYPGEGDHHESFVTSAMLSRHLELGIEMHFHDLFRNCPAVWERLQAALKSVHAHVEVSFKGSEPQLVIEPIADTAPNSDVFSWHADSKACAQAFLQQLRAMSVEMSSQVYQELIGNNRLKDILFRFLSDIIVIPCLEKNSIILVGFESSVCAARETTLASVKQAEVVMQQQNEDVVKLRPHVKTLFEDIDVVQSLPALFPGVSAAFVPTGKNKGSIRIEGLRDQVVLASGHILTASQRVVQVDVTLAEPKLTNILASSLGRDHVRGLLRATGLEATVYVTPASGIGPATISLVGWVDDGDRLGSIARQVEGSCSSEKLDLQQHEAEATASEEWTNFLASARDTHLVDVETGSVKDRAVMLLGLTRDMDGLKHRIAKFMSDNSRQSVRLAVARCQERCIGNYMKGKVGEIQKQLSLTNVNVRDGFISFRGMSRDAMRGKSAFQNLVSRLHTDSMVIEKPGISLLFNKDEVRKELKRIETSTHVVVELGNSSSALDVGETPMEIDFPNESTAGARYGNVSAGLASDSSHKLITAEGITITIRKGDLSKETADVVVCPASESLNLHQGMVASVLSRAAGSQLQAACSAHVQTNGSLSVGDCILVHGHQLACRFVAFCCSPQYGKGTGCQMLEKVVLKCLEIAAANKLSSIAFPSLGTGNLGFPPQDSARLMLKSAKEFSALHPGTTVCDVSFTIFDKAILQAFLAEASGHPKPTASVAMAVSESPMSPLGPLPVASSTAPTHRELGTLFAGTARASGLLLHLCQGDITQEKSDAVVVAAHSTLDFSSGVVIQRVRDLIGADRTAECAQYTQNGPLAPCSVVRVDGGRFASHLLLAVCPLFKAQRAGSTLQQTYWNALKEADTQGASSISFPALGTGNVGYSHADSATALVKAVNDFVTPLRHLKSIKVVLFDQASIQPFQLEFQRGFSEVSGGAAVSRSSTSAPRPSSVSSTASDNQVTFLFCGSSLDNVPKAKRDVQALCKEHYESKTLDLPEEVALDRHCSRAIREADSRYGVHVDRLSGLLIISGERLSVMTAYSEIRDLAAKQIEQVGREKHAARAAQMVQWFYVPNGAQSPLKFEALTNLHIEDTYQQFKTGGGPAVAAVAGHRLHEIDFAAMEERKGGQKTATVRRQDLTKTVVLPDHWNLSQGLTVRLAPTDAKYVEVSQRFFRTAVSGQILSIDRIQNETLYTQYQTKKGAMDNNPASRHKSNEQHLYHGTDHATAVKIQTQGFDRNFAGKNAIRFGRGVYFARDASYSENYARRPPRVMFQSLVLVGDYAQGSNNLLQPPQRSRHSVETLDCTVDNIGNPSIFVTYHDAQAYPEYLITFQ